MRVYVKGTGQKLDLTQKDYVGAGGEGTVYTRGGVAYKVYHDAGHMLPMGKIQALGAIQDPFVVNPLKVLVDKAGKPIGYTTKYVPKAWTLCQLFPPVFRKREGITPDTTKGLVRKLQDRVVNTHKAGILVVDMNEMNYLVTKGNHDLYGIDVDSYQTSQYPTLAIMESIRDWTVKQHQWTELSDWFSFAILSFQMFVGIHPFKGRYKGSKTQFKVKLPTDAADDPFAVTRRRMQGNISVFHPEVGVPGAALPFDSIPGAYRAWYEALFVKGQRCMPPTDFGATMIVVPIIKTVRGTATLDIVQIGSYEGSVIGVWGDGSKMVVSTDEGIWLGSSRVGITLKDHPKVWAHCGFSPRQSRAVAIGADPYSKVPILVNLTDRTQIPFSLQVESFSSYDGRLYVRTTDRVHEILLTDAGSQVIASTREVAQTLPHATKLYPGVVVQKLLGATFVSLLIRSGAAQQVQIKELDPYRIIDARFDRGVLMVIGEKKGQYDRLVFRFDGAGVYDVRIVAGIAMGTLNFVTLDSGICICLNEDDKLEMFSSRKGSSAMKYVEDPALSSDMQLSRQGGTVLFSQGNKVYTMRMK